VLDLPGHGRRQAEASSWENYAQAIGEVLAKQARPSVVVGHSMGGMAIAAAGELKPELVRKLIFLTAFAPLDGDTIDILVAGDKQSIIGQHLERLTDGRVIVAEAGLVPAFYADCPPETIELAGLSLTPQQWEATAAAIRVSPTRYGGLTKAYIYCEADRAIGIDKQREMANRAGITSTRTLATSHSPFFSAPTELVEAIEALA
jgi:pimeloyl-ACP methyl ester carboxylesterase